MTPDKFLDELDNPGPLYIFVGTEIGLMDQVIEDAQAQRYNSVSNAWNDLTRPSMFAGSNTMAVVRDDMDFLKQDKLIDNLPDRMKAGTLILIYSKLDKRLKLFKKYTKNIVVFDRLKTKELVPLFKDVLPENQLMRIFKLCGNDLLRIENEVDKVSRLEDEGVKYLLEDVITEEKTADVYEFVNALLNYKLKKALKALPVLKENGQSVIGMLALTYNCFRAAYLIAYFNGETVNPYERGMVAKNFNYSDQNIKPILKIIKEITEGTKSGMYTEDNALEFLIFKLKSFG